MEVTGIISLCLSIVSTLGLTGGTILYFRLNRRQKELENKSSEIKNETDILSIVDKQQETIFNLTQKQAELVDELTNQRNEKIELRNSISELKLENQRLTIEKCVVKGCTARRPPSEAMM